AAPGHTRRGGLTPACSPGTVPAPAALLGGAAGAAGPDAAEWFELLPLTGLQPDTRHRLRIGQAAARLVSHVRLEIHPDGGMARLRLFGELTAEGRARLGLAWVDRLPPRPPPPALPR